MIRGKVVYEPEWDCWKHLTKECMSDESDNEDGTKTRHTPKWRSDRKLLLMLCLDPVYLSLLCNCLCTKLTILCASIVAPCWH